MERNEEPEGYPTKEGNCSSFKMTKKMFKTLMDQVSTVHERIPYQNKFYGVQQNGRYLPAYDKRRHDIAMALLLGNRLKEEMFESEVSTGQRSNLEPKSSSSRKIASNDTTRLANQMSALSIGPRVWKPSRSTLQLVNPNEALTISTLPITSRVPHNGWLKENDSARRPRKCYSPPRRKSDAITFTIEEEREGKKILMSDPRFKLLFVPGYEVEEPDYLYVDPVPEDSPIEVLDQYIRGKYKGDDFIKRFIELRRLEEDTVYWEERQERVDVSSNNISPSSGEGYDRSVRILRGDKTVISKTPKTYSPYLSRSKLLSVEKDAKISRAKSAPAIKSTHTQSSGKEFNNYCNTCKLAWKHNHRKKRTKSAKAMSGKLKPTKYYDVVDIAETFEVPCQEKIKSKAREFPLSARNSSILPGKSFTSQRKDSLTNLKRRRPKTGVKTKSSNKTKRPVTANPVTRRKAKVS